MPNGRKMEQYIDLCDPHTGQCMSSSLYENDLLWALELQNIKNTPIITH